MEELKNLTTKQLEKVVEEINKELCERRNKKRQNAYENLVNAMKDFRETEFYETDNCYFTIFCDRCDDKTDVDFFENFDIIIKELERNLI